MKPILVQTTTNSIKEAKKISKILLEKKLVACVQVSKIDSFYVWKDDFCEDEEFLISIKTKKENFEKIERKIKELHSYDVPEIISFKIDNLSKEYKKFICQSC
ncbi:divalent-cation tolerance protein CutA [Malaciobacter marinus]|uniref:Divalent-cation tolerance protein CutA n=1 Tax=Malaciobacter marinus TaxID=505249 RepID=A0A347THG5_9BACT|nr:MULTISPECIES: divalent-cation tolerance protein CutA [Malaciobacter]AXX86043.1 putative CutA divalent ion tolerance protein [Malaciobacter marinus]PHO12575.1 divalent-cation tolerance protein CutA [Malaciobacter marinus]PHO14578.1 divalent-cation tolerance protein CutA [Malaciobacter marinus]RYA22496.1 divalent-cation tolerance protein CutA [Malaciobacter halophilus]